MRIARWINDATDTHSEYVILTASPWQYWLRERASLLRLCAHSLPCDMKKGGNYQLCLRDRIYHQSHRNRMSVGLKSDHDCMPYYVHNNEVVVRVILLWMIIIPNEDKYLGTKNGFLEQLDRAMAVPSTPPEGYQITKWIKGVTNQKDILKIFLLPHRQKYFQTELLWKYILRWHSPVMSVTDVGYFFPTQNIRTQHTK